MVLCAWLTETIVFKWLTQRAPNIKKLYFIIRPLHLDYLFEYKIPLFVVLGLNKVEL